MENSASKIRNTRWKPPLAAYMQLITENPNHSNWARINRIRIGKEVKVYLFTNNMILYIENLTGSIKNHEN